MSKLNFQINETVTVILNRISDRLTRVARDTRQNTDAISALTDKQRTDIEAQQERLAALADKVSTFEEFQKYQARVNKFNDEQEARQTLRDQNNVQSLYNLRDSTQKSFYAVREDMKSLVARAQRFNERLGQIESQNISMASSISLISNRTAESVPYDHVWVNKKLTGVYDSINEIETRVKELEKATTREELRKALPLVLQLIQNPSFVKHARESGYSFDMEKILQLLSESTGFNIIVSNVIKRA